MKSKTITKESFLENLYDIDSYLKLLIKKHKITKNDYYENILLPFKFGAVSMAHKTNSKIVPFAITGDYKFRSKNLTVRIGKPIEANDDLEESNKRLRKAIIDLIKENDKDSGK